ncbi:unnamed protein product [Urochloa humidicola]
MTNSLAVKIISPYCKIDLRDAARHAPFSPQLVLDPPRAIAAGRTAPCGERASDFWRPSCSPATLTLSF